MRSLLALLATASMAALPAPATDTDAARSELANELKSFIDGPGWSSDDWSVMVVSLDGGDTLFAHQPDAPLMPASNMKLFTTAAALHYLGPDYRYATYLAANGPLEQGVVQGDLLVYGTGDPTISARFFESKTAVWEALADSLASIGVQRISGDIVGDASYFEGPGVGEGWQTNYITHSYAAPASALSFNDNIVTLRVKPGPSAGAKPEVTLIPGGEVIMRNEATTVASGQTRIRVEREAYDAPIVITGQVRQGDRGVWRAVPVVSPPAFTASMLEEILEARGIAVTGSVRAVTDAAASPITGRSTFAPVLEEGRPVVQTLAVHRSPPLLEILKVINQRSHNLYAESVLRTVGRVATGSGSAQGGEAAVKSLLQEAGTPGEVLRMDDGSGLSVLDRASAGSIVGLLEYMAEESPHWDAYWETLPEAATSRGLRRMQQTAAAGNLRAKTGTIDRVSALSGYVTTQNDERLAFSILSNNVPSTWTAKRIEDRIGARLASLDRPRPTGRAGRLAAAPPTAEAATADTSAAAEGPDTGRAVASAAAESDTSPVAESETSPEAASPRTYTIKKGDTLDAIARRLGTTVPALQAANPGVNARRLMPGQTLNLPRNGD